MWRRTQTGDNMSCDEGRRLETICHVTKNADWRQYDHTEAKINRSSFFSLNIEYTLWNGTLIYSGKEIYLINLMLFEYQSYIKRTSIIPDTEYVTYSNHFHITLFNNQWLCALKFDTLYYLVSLQIYYPVLYFLTLFPSRLELMNTKHCWN
jgi:hypothetical protein